MKKNKKLPSLRDHKIRRLLFGKGAKKYSFSTIEEAQNTLLFYRNSYVISKKLEIDEFNKDELYLWIRDLKYEKDLERYNKGYIGEFVRIWIDKNPKAQRYQFLFEFLIKDLKFHPQKKYIRKKIPNFGEPYLRSILRGKEYIGFDHAKKCLDDLVEYYPEATVRATLKKLYIMIYQKSDTDNNVLKYTLEIKDFEENRFKIVLEKNLIQGGQMTRRKFYVFPI